MAKVIHLYYPTNKSSSKVGASKAKQAMQRYKAKRAMGMQCKKPKVKHNPAPKLPKLPITLKGLAKVQLGYNMHVWHMGTNSYVNTFCTINAYVTSINSAGTIATCYIPKLRTKPSFTVYAVTPAYNGTFIAGLHNYYIVKYLPTKQ